MTFNKMIAANTEEHLKHKAQSAGEMQNFSNVARGRICHYRWSLEGCYSTFSSDPLFINLTSVPQLEG
jgi:hypothetical protein